MSERYRGRLCRSVFSGDFSRPSQGWRRFGWQLGMKFSNLAISGDKMSQKWKMFVELHLTSRLPTKISTSSGKLGWIFWDAQRILWILSNLFVALGSFFLHLSARICVLRDAFYGCCESKSIEWKMLNEVVGLFLCRYYEVVEGRSSRATHPALHARRAANGPFVHPTTSDATRPKKNKKTLWREGKLTKGSCDGAPLLVVVLSTPIHSSLFTRPNDLPRGTP